MIVSDLNFVQQRAAISGGLICIGQDRCLTPAEFQFSGLVLISYEAAEERELQRAGIVSATPPTNQAR
jgi:hypothetical protein